MTSVHYGKSCLVQKHRAVLKRERCATRIISSPCDKWVLIAVYEKGFGMYITERLYRVHDRSIAEITDNCSSILFLDDNE